MSENRVIRDEKVAVIYNPGFGCGWYTEFCWIDELLFDPKLVEIILHPSFKNMRYEGSTEYKYDEELDSKICEYLNEVNNRKYIIPYGHWKGSIFQINNKNRIYKLDIKWIPVDKKFFITQYDGSETVHVDDENDKDGIRWIKA
jgi:hypothetical protein